MTDCNLSKKLSFYDCPFYKEVVLENLVLSKGTDILENQDKPYGNSFEVEPQILI